MYNTTTVQHHNCSIKEFRKIGTRAKFGGAVDQNLLRRLHSVINQRVLIELSDINNVLIKLHSDAVLFAKFKTPDEIRTRTEFIPRVLCYYHYNTDAPMFHYTMKLLSFIVILKFSFTVSNWQLMILCTIA